MTRKNPQQPPLYFTLAVGIVIPALLVLIGLHDVLTGRTLLTFSSAQFRENIARYHMTDSAAVVNGLALIGLGLGLFLRFLGRRLGLKRIPLDRIAAGLLILSVAALLFAYLFLGIKYH